jgi:hypothetical protein
MKKARVQRQTERPNCYRRTSFLLGGAGENIQGHTKVIDQSASGYIQKVVRLKTNAWSHYTVWLAYL